MDQPALVERQINDGLWLIQQLSQNNFDVTAAFWIKVSEDGQWLLYIASKNVDEMRLPDAYRIIHETLGIKDDLWINPFQIRLIGANNPITQDVLRVRGTKPEIGTWYRGSRLGNIYIDDAYLYGPLRASEEAHA